MSTAAPSESKKQPPVILCIGMAGSGKTTFMQVILSLYYLLCDMWITRSFLENQCSSSREKDTSIRFKS